jgi:hypothetical protein
VESSSPDRARTERLVRRLGETTYSGGSGFIEILDWLVQAGVTVPEGVVLTRAAHAEFLDASGLGRRISRFAGEIEDSRRVFNLSDAALAASEGEVLRAAVCEALIDLGARTVSVLSEHGRWGGLETLPEVMDASRAAWLSPRGLEWQIRAAATGRELPTWLILIQRESPASRPRAPRDPGRRSRIENRERRETL